MQKLLATLAIIMSCGVVVLIAQNEWDVDSISGGAGGAGQTMASGPSAEARKAEAEADIRGMIDRGMTYEQILQANEDRTQEALRRGL